MTTSLRIITHESMDSTNSLARRMIEAGEVDSELVIVARTQTGGRGQFSRSWSSPAGGLWCTHVLGAAGVAMDGLGLRIGLACARTVEGSLRRVGNGNDVRLKWPNDVYVVGKKVLGVLTESVAAHGKRFLLIGVGINANFGACELPPEVAARATTLRDRTGATFDLEEMREELTANLQRALAVPGLDRAMLAEARYRLHGVGQEAEVRDADGNTIRGTLMGLDESGCPIVRRSDAVQ